LVVVWSISGIIVCVLSAEHTDRWGAAGDQRTPLGNNYIKSTLPFKSFGSMRFVNVFCLCSPRLHLFDSN